MDQSRRAVEAYWRSRMVDGVTSDEDKVAPVYKLEEICELLRTSHVSIVKEVSDYILKRLDHKSPLVKQKALRLIKYAVGKSGTEFRREMQRHSAVIRQLFHYKGHPDPLKGDALNKAVRDTAHETVSAIFANDDSKVVAPTEGIQKRIQGFGNTNYEMPSEEKKSFLSEVVGIGLSTIAAANSMRKSDGGNYKSPNLRRSLTTEMGSRDRYEGDEYHTESYASSGSAKNVASGGWGDDLRTTITSSAVTVDTTSGHSGIKSREERLLDTIVTSGGVRLQPTRDAIQVFLMEASKLDAVAMSHALEIKLQSPIWQVRMKACCVLEAILRKNDEQSSIITSYFSENRDSVVKCSELPQVSLREKATKVLNLLEGDPIYGTENAGAPSNAKPVLVPAVEMPDLIDTGEADDYGSGTSLHKDADNKNIGNVVASSSASVVDDLFGDVPGAGLVGSSENKNEDPFADVSFHVTEDKQHDDIFSGLTVVNDKRSEHELKLKSSNESGLFDVFGGSDPNHLFLQEEPESSSSSNKKANLNDLMDGLSLNNIMQDNNTQPGASPFINGINRSNQKPMSDGALNGGLGSNSYFSVSPLQYNNVPQLQPNVMVFNPAFATQPMMNYGGAMGAAFIAHQQQQFLFENIGNLKPVYGQATGSAADGAYSSPLPIPDIFQLSNNPLQSHASVVTASMKEDTKAFDFISDHLAAARDPKRVL